MDLTVRTVEDDSELLELFRAVERAFLNEPKELDEPTEMMRLALDRTAAVFDGDEIVGSGRNFPLELTLPGGNRLPMAGVSWIGTATTHRRRGVMTAVMGALHNDAVAHGDPVMGLLASEGLLYERFGFGVASLTTTLEMERGAVVLNGPPDPDGRCRVLAVTEARETLPLVYDSLLSTRPGQVSRPKPWWSDEYFDDMWDKRFFHTVVHETASGVVDGYASYTVEQNWPDGIARAKGEVREIVAADPVAHFAIWRYLLSLDLVHTLRVLHAAPDDPIHHALVDRRRVRVVEQRDQLWLRLLDVPAVLGAREYAADGELVIQVLADAADPAAGTFELRADGDGARCEPTNRAPELVVDGPTLSSLVLGGSRWSGLARAGRVAEPGAGALQRADAMFAADPLPLTGTSF